MHSFVCNGVRKIRQITFSLENVSCIVYRAITNSFSNAFIDSITSFVKKFVLIITHFSSLWRIQSKTGKIGFNLRKSK